MYLKVKYHSKSPYIDSHVFSFFWNDLNHSSFNLMSKNLSNPKTFQKLNNIQLDSRLTHRVEIFTRQCKTATELLTNRHNNPLDSKIQTWEKKFSTTKISINSTSSANKFHWTIEHFKIRRLENAIDNRKLLP